MSETTEDPEVVAAGGTGSFDHPALFEGIETEDHSPGFMASDSYDSGALAGDFAASSANESLPPLVRQEEQEVPVTFSEIIRAELGGGK